MYQNLTPHFHDYEPKTPATRVQRKRKQYKFVLNIIPITSRLYIKRSVHLYLQKNRQQAEQNSL